MELLAAHAPCVILVDELVRYVAQFEEGKALTGGSFDSNLSFVQALTEALKAVPNAMMLASLPESDREAGSQRGVKALQSLSHYFGRVQALWKPVATEEAFEIVRRRLFANVTDKLASEAVCRQFADLYTANPTDFPNETQEARYYTRLLQAYPIHPEVFDRLYEDWSSLDSFQRTRGVLKLMAKVIHRLWKDGNNDLLVMPGSLPLYDGDVRNEVMYYLPQGWDPVLEGDIDGDRAEATDIDSREPLLGSLQACRRAARTVFLGSAPTTATQNNRGIDLDRVMLGAAQPGQPTGRIKDAMGRLTDRLHYLNHNNNRYWFDTRPNLRREMDDRKKRFDDRQDVFPQVRERLGRLFSQGIFGGVHVFAASGDVPDDWALRLVVLPLDAAYSKSGQSLAIEQASQILKQRGESPRVKQNRLVFLAPEQDTVARLREQVRTMLAWQSIVNDSREGRLNLDMYMSRQANKSLEDAQDSLKRMLREAFRWLLVPMQDVQPGKGMSEVKWDRFQINPAAPALTADIERVLKENELVISEWAPVHLTSLLKSWFWKSGEDAAGALDVWQKSCCYLYMPRLKDDAVFVRAVAAGVASQDFFGLAYGRNETQYSGLIIGQSTSPIFDSSLLLITTEAALAQKAAALAAQQALANPGHGSGTTGATGSAAVMAQEPGNVATAVVHTGTTTAVAARPVQTRFFGVVELDPVMAKLQFAQVVDEVILLFSKKTGVTMSIRVDIEAESAAGFDEATQRAARENCKVLKFNSSDFEGDS